MLFMIVEHFKDGDPRPVYARFAERGRMAPDGLEYRGSWVTTDLARCYQVMEGERELLDEWIARWADLIDFEMTEVLGSAEAAASVLG
jgi:hypothetical protein